MTAQLSAPAIGYRAFKWDGSGPLKSVGVEASWTVTRKPQQAKCLQTPMHSAPQEDCTCGLYAHSTPESVGVGGVGGVVMGYGNLIIHPDGWRAQTVELVALVARDGLTGSQRECEHVWAVRVATLACEKCFAPMQATRVQPGLDLVAAAYGVRLLDRWEDAAAVAREHGAEPIPEILHAEAEAWHLGPEKHEPLLPDGIASHYGDLERRIRELVPWLKRPMIRQVEMQQHLMPMNYFAAQSVTVPACMEIRLCIVHPELQAEVEITLHG